jgi:hypothetical protein
MTVPTNHIRQIKVVSDCNYLAFQRDVNAELEEGWAIGGKLKVTPLGQYSVIYTILLTK